MPREGCTRIRARVLDRGPHASYGLYERTAKCCVLPDQARYQLRTLHRLSGDAFAIECDDLAARCRRGLRSPCPGRPEAQHRDIECYRHPDCYAVGFKPLA